MKIDYRWTGNFLLTLSRCRSLVAHLLHAGLQRPRRHRTHLAGRLIAELLRGDAERFTPSPICRITRSPAGARCAFRYRDGRGLLQPARSSGRLISVNSEESKGVKHEQQ